MLLDRRDQSESDAICSDYGLSPAPGGGEALGVEGHVIAVSRHDDFEGAISHQRSGSLDGSTDLFGDHRLHLGLCLSPAQGDPDKPKFDHALRFDSEHHGAEERG